MSATPLIRVGLIGLHCRDLRWTEVESRVAGRVSVVAVWDAVSARLAAVEKEQERRDGDRAHRAPKTYASVSNLAEHAGLQAAIVLDAGWPGLWAARRIADEQVPVLWLGEWPKETAWSFGGIGRDLIVPGLRLRVCPATLRLRELMATELGAVHRIDAVCGSGLARWELLDWATSVLGSRIVDRDQSEGDVVRFHHACGAITNVVESEETSARISTARGVAIWRPDDCLEWSVGDSNEFQRVDTSHDRASVTVLLDLFFRRVVGGLIPQPSVDEVGDAIRHAGSASS